LRVIANLSKRNTPFYRSRPSHQDKSGEHAGKLHTPKSVLGQQRAPGKGSGGRKNEERKKKNEKRMGSDYLKWQVGLSKID
jgi:hypothetical protein